MPTLWIPGRKELQELTPLERRAIFGISSLFVLRMLGFYLVLPILSTYSRSLHGSTALLAGLSVGVYGLTQFLFQVPFGALSDRWGRKPLLTAGLLFFAIGSAVCGMAHSAWALVFGRTIQGMGVVASTALAMLGDLTRDEVRTRAMVSLGIALGGSFSIGLLFGPSASEHFGVPALFWFTALLAVLAVPLLWIGLPSPQRVIHHDDVEISTDRMLAVLKSGQLLRLDFGTMNLHMSLTAIFVTLPFLLQKLLPLGHQWHLFLPLLGVGMISMLSAAKLSERGGGSKRVLHVGQVGLVTGLALLALAVPPTVRQPGAHVPVLVAGLVFFIGGFAMLELLLPALLTRCSDVHSRGTAAGVFNMSQFSGAFFGGLLAGFFLERDLQALYWILAGTGTIWLIAALRLRDPGSLAQLAVGPAGNDPE
jgi:MFS family permease